MRRDNRFASMPVLYEAVLSAPAASQSANSTANSSSNSSSSRSNSSSTNAHAAGEASAPASVLPKAGPGGARRALFASDAASIPNTQQPSSSTTVSTTSTLQQSSLFERAKTSIVLPPVDFVHFQHNRRTTRNSHVNSVNSNTTLGVNRSLVNCGSALSALSVSPDGRHVCIAGREVLKIMSLQPRLLEGDDYPGGDSMNAAMDVYSDGGSMTQGAGVDGDVVQFDASGRRSNTVGHSGGAAAMGRSGNTANEGVIINSNNISNTDTLPSGLLAEVVSLRGGGRKQMNLNYASNDVQWHPLPSHGHMLATAAPNGAVCIWDLNSGGTGTRSRNTAATGSASAAAASSTAAWTSSGQKLSRVIEDHARTANRVAWHPDHPFTLLSCSQDGDAVLWDIRDWKNQSKRFTGRAEAVRDVKFSRTYTNYFAAGCDNGQLLIWDIRFNKSCKTRLTAHDGPVFCVDWHPTLPNLVATGGRDRYIKVWDLAADYGTAPHAHRPEYVVRTVGSVARVTWRPGAPTAFDSRLSVLREAAVSSVSSAATLASYASESRSGETGEDKQASAFRQAAHDADLAWTGWRRRYSAECSNHITSVYSHDPQVHVWNVTSPFIPHLQFEGRRDAATTDLAWLSPDEVLSVGKDGTVRIDHVHGPNVVHPQQHVPTTAMSWRPSASALASISQSIDRSIPGRDAYDALHTTLTTARTALLAETTPRVTAIVLPPKEERVERPKPLRRYDTADSPHVVDVTAFNPVGPLRGMPDGPEISHDVFLSLATSYKLYPPKSGASTVAEVCELNSAAGVRCGHIAAADLWDTIAIFWGDNACPAQEQDLEKQGFAGLNDSIRSDESTYATPDQLLSPSAASADMPPRFGEMRSARLPTLLDAVAQRFPMQQPRTESVPSKHSNEELAPVPLQMKFHHGLSPLNLHGSWDPSIFVRKTLNQMAEYGDVQTPATVAIVLGGHLWVDAEQEGKDCVRRWVAAYVWLLHQAQLYSAAALVIRSSNDSAIRKKSQQSTTIHTSCPSCGKPLNTNGYACANCKRTTNPCSVCHETCRGLYVWCQGCGHGGHAAHIRKWHTESPFCPTGCGHRCITP